MTASCTSSRRTCPGGATNQAPIGNAGPDQTVILPNAATLDGTVADDGRPYPPGAVTTTWEKVTGFGTVTFGNPNAVDTTAQFSVEGTYVLRLTANDGQASVADDITVTVAPHVTGAFTKTVVAVGERTRFKGTVSPAADGQPVRLQRRKGGEWVNVATKHLEAGNSSAYKFNIRRGDSGRYRYRIRVPAYAGTPSAAFGGPAKGLLLRVYRAEITAVHPGGDEFVAIANTGAVPMDIDGWVLLNKGTRKKRTLTDLVVRPGHCRADPLGRRQERQERPLPGPQGHVGSARNRGAAQRQVGAAGPVALLSRRQRRALLR